MEGEPVCKLITSMLIRMHMRCTECGGSTEERVMSPVQNYMGREAFIEGTLELALGDAFSRQNVHM